MALENDEYVPEDADTLYDVSSDAVADTASGEIEDFEGSIVQALIRGNAEMLAQYHEQALDELYDAAYLETASGKHLDAKVREVGITRNEATPATGVQQFARDTAPLSEYLIQKGTAVETANGAVTFETTEKGTLTPLALFEKNSLDSAWSGDTTSFGTTTTYANDGSYSLEVGATSGVDIYRTDVTVSRGDRVQGAVRIGTDNAVGLMVGVQDADNFLEARVDAVNGRLELHETDSGTTTELKATQIAAPTDVWATVEIDIEMDDVVAVTLYDSNDDAVDRIETTYAYTYGGVGVISRDGSSTKHVDTITRTATTLNIEATEGGEQTNVGADRLVELPSPPTGVTATTNPLPTGDPDFLDTNGKRLVIGTDRETDEQLRERAIAVGSRGGAATVGAIETALADIDDVIHTEAFENEQLSTNNGLPPLSVEFLIYGGNDEEIANALHANVGVTERLASGVNGTAVTYDIEDDFLNDVETYEWSEPTETTVDITVDVVVTDTFEGRKAVKNTLVEYVGGTRTDGGFRSGIDIGEDIRHDGIRDRLVGDDLGIVGIANITLDKSGDGTDDSTTNADGLDVLSVPTANIATTDATDDSITVNIQ